jgi:hypothetical protein
MDTVASQPSPTNKLQGQPAQPAKGRCYAAYYEGGPGVGETPQSSPPRVRATKRQPTTFGCTPKVVAPHPSLLVLSVTLGAIIGCFLFLMMDSQPILLTQPTTSPLIVPPTTPLCHREVPNGPPAHISAGQPVRWADYPKLVYLQTRTFDQLLDESVDYKWLAWEVKEVEVASNDLITSGMASNDFITSVRESGSESKDQTVETLGRLVDYAGETGRSLYSLGERIQGAVDS